MLLGSIYKIGSTLNVSAQLCDVKTGRVIGPAQAQGSRVEDVYQMVNKLTEEIINVMGIPLPKDSQPLKINDVTTRSFEAYKHYQKALDQWKNADEDLPELMDAKTRLARLKRGR